MQAYRDGELTLAQLEAFTVTDDPVRQDEVYQGLDRFGSRGDQDGADAGRHVGAGPASSSSGSTLMRSQAAACCEDLFSTTDEGLADRCRASIGFCLGKLGEIADGVRQGRLALDGSRWSSPTVTAAGASIPTSSIMTTKPSRSGLPPA